MQEKLQESKRSYVKTVFRVIVIGLLVWILYLVAQNPMQVRYQVQDWWRLRDYEPTEEIVSLSDQIELTDRGQRIFYATHPQLLNKSEFSEQCPIRERANVLGCYVSRSNIYVLDVEEQSIEEVEPVTAAHELLHAVWARLGNEEKNILTRELERVYAKVKNEDLERLIDGYKASNVTNDPDLLPNELHSILGTEVAELSPELEDHYDEYLGDRGAIVSLYQSYADEFDRRQARITQIKDELSALRSKIEQTNQEIDSLISENNEVVAEIRRLREEDRVEESNQLVPRQNRLADRINGLISQVNADIERYNNLVKENNDLAFELSQLSDSLDARTDNVN